MAAKWETYRMWYQLAYVVSNNGNSAEVASNWKPSDFTFRGRTQEEAQGKARRFWQNAEFGAGAIVCVLEGQRP